MSDTLVNRVAESGLITLRPEEWIPQEETIALDIVPFLFQGLMLHEQDFREQMKAYDWTVCRDKIVCFYCSADAIVPSWAYMLMATLAAPYAKAVFFGTPEQWISKKLLDHVHQMDATRYRDQRIVIKGCSGGVNIGPEVYVALTSKLVPVVKSLMFGEPCSTVPVYKRPKGT